MKWCRLYNETASDPKFRYIAATAGVSPAIVLGVWTAMLCRASDNKGDARGTLAGFDCRIVAFDLGLEPAVLLRIRNAMEGFLIDGDFIIAWQKRQFESDASRERTRAYRERKSSVTSPSGACDVTPAESDVSYRHVTVCDMPEERRGEEIRKDKTASSVSTIEVGHAPRKARRLPPDWQPSPEDAGYADKIGLDPSRVCENFRDYWHAKSGASATKMDWSATWRMWCRREAERQPAGAPQQKRGRYDWIIDDLQQGKLT
jgi:hypothetical protein